MTRLVIRTRRLCAALQRPAREEPTNTAVFRSLFEPAVDGGITVKSAGETPGVAHVGGLGLVGGAAVADRASRNGEEGRKRAASGAASTASSTARVRASGVSPGNPTMREAVPPDAILRAASRGRRPIQFSKSWIPKRGGP